MKILITGGAGFIGSNLVDHFLSLGHSVVCLDNLSTGFLKNIKHNLGNPHFTFVEGDIRNYSTCLSSIQGCEYVCHHAALGSVPRSISDPLNTNSVNVDGFLNILMAAKENGIKRFVYATSSSTYGDSIKLPKVENEIGRPLSPYAVTKYINELYAEVFAKTYTMQCIGLRYFNVFGKRQDPNGMYAAVIPLWAKKIINHEQPEINGDGTISRDFTFIENVIEANERALFIPTDEFLSRRENYSINYSKAECHINTAPKAMETLKQNYFSEVFNIAFGKSTTLLNLFNSLRDNLAKYDPEILNINPIFGQNRIGDILHSIANIDKAKLILGYNPSYDAQKGFELAASWYYINEKKVNSLK